MPKKKTAKKKATKQKTFEQNLWESAAKLRGTVASSEYKHIVLSLIFPKFDSDKFEERQQELDDEGREAYTLIVWHKTSLMGSTDEQEKIVYG